MKYLVVKSFSALEVSGIKGKEVDVPTELVEDLLNAGYIAKDKVVVEKAEPKKTTPKKKVVKANEGK